MVEEKFLTPRFVGKRFNDHSIPLEVLKDLAALEPMLKSVARELFFQKHRARSHLPKRYIEGVSLSLAGVDEGSAIANLALTLAVVASGGESRREIMVEARDAVVKAVEAAADGEDPARYVPRKALVHFDAFGRSLKDDEAIELSGAGPEKPARLTRLARLRLLEAAEVKIRHEEIQLKGGVHAADLEKGVFSFVQLDGSRVTGQLTPRFRGPVMDALKSYLQGQKVAIEGVGEYDNDDRLLSITSIEQIIMLDLLDIQVQFAELAALRDGWFDGLGSAYDKDHLAWLADAFTDAFPDTLPLPCIYPTPDGAVRFEWGISPWDVSLTVDLRSRSGDWHALNLDTDEEEAESYLLDLGGRWSDIMVKLQGMAGDSDD